MCSTRFCILHRICTYCVWIAAPDWPWRLSDGALQKCTPKETSTVKKTTRFKVGQRGERGVNSVAITSHYYCGTVSVLPRVEKQVAQRKAKGNILIITMAREKSILVMALKYRKTWCKSRRNTISTCASAYYTQRKESIFVQIHISNMKLTTSDSTLKYA